VQHHEALTARRHETGNVPEVKNYGATSSLARF
jgi:hypothetical protein